MVPFAWITGPATDPSSPPNEQLLTKSISKRGSVFKTPRQALSSHPRTVGGIAYICFKWFHITADAHPGVSGVSKDQKFCDKFKNTHCQVDHPAIIE